MERLSLIIDYLEKKGKYILILAICTSFILHLPIFTLEIQGNHSWRQTQTMWNVRNFVRHDSNILNPRGPSFNGGMDNIQRHEFPVMQYAVALIHKTAGEKILLTRTFLFLQCMIFVLGFYKLCVLLSGSYLASAAGATFLLFSPLVYYYGINPMPDNLALAGIAWYLFFLFRYEKEKRRTDIFYSGLCLLIATLAKLPFLMFAIVSIYFYIRELIVSKKMKAIRPGIIQLLLLTPAFIWYAWVAPTWSGDYVTKGIFSASADMSLVRELINYQFNIMLPHRVMYIPVWMACATGVIGLMYTPAKWRGALISILCISLTYLFYEITWIGKVHDYYMMPLLIFCFLLSSLGVATLLSVRKWNISLALLLGLLIWSPIYAYRNYQKIWYPPIDYFNPDVYENRALLQDIAPNDALCIILNDESGYVFSYNIDKMGHIFNHDLRIEWIGDMIDNHGVEYMYSDSEVINDDPALMQFVDTLLLVKGSVNVYKLRPPRSDFIRDYPEIMKQ